MISPDYSSVSIPETTFIRFRFKPVVLSLLLAVMTLIVFWPVTQCGFINYDDPEYFTSNQHVLSGLTSANFAWAFTTSHASNWHPLTWLSLMFDAKLFGRNAIGPHLTNLLFHAANVTLLFLLLLKLTAATWRSAAVAALFALHPLHVESVAWIAERKDVLSTFFALLALLSYARYAKENHRGNLRFALIFFALGLMSKPMLVTLPFIMLLLDWWPLQKAGNFRHLVIEKILFFLLGLISCVITFIVQKKSGAVAALIKLPLDGRIENAFVSYARYLGKTFWPAPLAVPYPYPGHWDLPLVIYAATLVIGLSAISILFAHKFPFVFTGWFWFVGTLIPVIGLVQVGDAAMADRYTYFPLIGIFIVFVWGGTEMCVSWRLPKPAVGVSAILVLFFAAAQTRSQIACWKSSEILFRHTLAVTENNYVAWNDLGTCLSGQGQLPEAMDCFQKSLEINPDNADAFYNMGNVLVRLGNVDGAINNYRRALELDPNHADILDNLGFALAQKRRFDEAVSCFEKALQLKPDSADTHNNFAAVLFVEHRFDEAAQHYRKAIRLAPNDAQFFANLGDTLVRLGQPAEAAQNYQTALRLNPDDARTRLKLQSLGPQISN
jgi:tetratricopeptide (TPR) repeat protein